MSTPFYVSPQQAMADRAEYARKGIARGRSLVVLQYADGIVFVGENPSRALHKFSEIYDRIGFAAAGKYNEYENLRIGASGTPICGDTPTTAVTSPRAVWRTCTRRRSARSSPAWGEAVRGGAGGGRGRGDPEHDQIYRLPHDGSIVDEHGSVAVGATRSRSAGTSTSGTGTG